MVCPCISTHTGTPNSRKLDTFGFHPCHIWYGVAFTNEVVYNIFCKYAACVTASSQRNSGSFEAASIVHESSTSVLFICLATPFCEGEYGAVN